MTDQEAAIREKLRSVNTETLPPDDLEYASDLDWLLAELAAAREREQQLRSALTGRHEDECACDFPGSGGCASSDYGPLAALAATEGQK